MANVGEIETDGVLRRCLREVFRTLVVLFRRPLRMSTARAGRLPPCEVETSSMGAFTAYQCGGKPTVVGALITPRMHVSRGPRVAITLKTINRAA